MPLEAAFSYNFSAFSFTRFLILCTRNNRPKHDNNARSVQWMGPNPKRLWIITPQVGYSYSTISGTATKRVQQNLSSCEQSSPVMYKSSELNNSTVGSDTVVSTRAVWHSKYISGKFKLVKRRNNHDGLSTTTRHYRCVASPPSSGTTAYTNTASSGYQWRYWIGIDDSCSRGVEYISAVEDRVQKEGNGRLYRVCNNAGCGYVFFTVLVVDFKNGNTNVRKF